MAGPRTLTLTLETVTPLFLGGADPREEPPELRPPAFRGAMRYWLRAALGGAIGDVDIDGLHTLESAVFGSTSVGSPISVRLSGNLRATSQRILPHKPGGSRAAFLPGQTFRLTLQQAAERGDDQVWEAACAALDLALTCGGVGLRSRRGHGVLRVAESASPQLIAPSPDSQVGWSRRAQAVVKHARATAGSLARSRDIRVAPYPEEPTRFPSLSRAMRMRVYDMRAPTAMDAVREFMSRAPADPAFGGIHPRQASPLWVRPVAMGATYGLLFTVLPSAFDRADYRRIDDFIKANFSREARSGGGRG